jgi:hypothetical protein
MFELNLLDYILIIIIIFLLFEKIFIFIKRYIKIIELKLKPCNRHYEFDCEICLENIY